MNQPSLNQKSWIVKNVFGNNQNVMPYYKRNIEAMSMPEKNIHQFVLVDAYSKEWLQENCPNAFTNPNITIMTVVDFLCITVDKDPAFSEEDRNIIYEFISELFKRRQYAALNDIISQISTSYNKVISDAEVKYHFDADVLLSNAPSQSGDEITKNANVSFIPAHRVRYNDTRVLLPIKASEEDHKLLHKGLYKKILEQGFGKKRIIQQIFLQEVII